jgi:hypothetical protein
MRDKVERQRAALEGSWDLLSRAENSQSNWGPRPVSVINRGPSPDNCALLYNIRKCWSGMVRST